MENGKTKNQKIQKRRKAQNELYKAKQNGIICNDKRESSRQYMK